MDNTKSQKLIENVTSILGFDPTKGPRPNSDAFAKALEKIQQERQEKAQEQAENMARELVAKAEAFAKVQKQYQQAEQSFVKEFEKALNRVKALSSGGAVEEESEGTSEAPEESK